MATIGGSNAVRSGLVLSLDAANARSYVSGSTIWRDLSGNGNNGTLTNGPTFDSGSINAISFNGVDNFVTMNSSTSLTTATPTLIVTCTTNSGTVLAKGGYGSHWNYGLLSLNSTSFRARNNNSDVISPSFTASTSTYNVYAIVWTGSTMQFYRNGVYGGDNATNYSPSAQNSLFLRIGCAWNNNTSQNVEFYSGKIATIQVYNRALSASEILQNFNASQARFNL
jgi:hypothetical protein